MKSMTQIANECNITYDEVQRCVIKQNIKGTIKQALNRVFFDKYQEELIHENLYFEGKLNHYGLKVHRFGCQT